MLVSCELEVGSVPYINVVISARGLRISPDNGHLTARGGACLWIYCSVCAFRSDVIYLTN